ncbi:putative glycolipid-binding domain-containing protein [Streptomyces indicus]|uniref:Glycolipid-binding n=1 Tax=Streptomyces indicus TaxID=417292 RepID=A0A1G9ERU7_9ACTN|nr:putative glycolipid-binding domain-containing protein [Streptomyces indicus]SDK78866.1 hypothetical protein SAMN05421806_11224 [Streptomyces indicus]
MTDSRVQEQHRHRARTRVLTWQVTETGGFETAWVTETGPRAFTAHGRVFAALPYPYWLSYDLETGPDWITRRLTVTAETTDGTGHLEPQQHLSSQQHRGSYQHLGPQQHPGPQQHLESHRHLDLRRDEATGAWTANGAPLPWAGPDTLDCDLGLSPLTNAMPVLRHALHRTPGTRDFTMAWVSVPDLTVHASPQTYAYEGPGPAGTRVHFTSGAFESEVEFDASGFVTSYAGLAHRLTPR